METLFARDLTLRALLAAGDRQIFFQATERRAIGYPRPIRRGLGLPIKLRDGWPYLPADAKDCCADAAAKALHVDDREARTDC
jgi:hypothetical protein